MDYRLDRNTIEHKQGILLSGLPENTRLIEDSTGCGLFLEVRIPSTDRHYGSIALGTLPGLRRFTACARVETPFWMQPRAGDRIEDLPPETQWMMARLDNGLVLTIVPLVDAALRFSLAGGSDGLQLRYDSGDPEIRPESGVALFLAVDHDPYRLMADGARAVQQRLQSGALRNAKALPDFIDRFGWNTWNAFYRDVTAADVRRGLERLRELGLPVGYVILDDGWLSVRENPAGGSRLTGFAANDKFPGGLAALIADAKKTFGVKRFLVWHAIMGYWGGVDASALPDYAVHDTPRTNPPFFREDLVKRFSWMGERCGVVPANRVADFFEDFHRELAAQDVDGVKIDNQSSLEFSASGQGGRVALSLATRRALEASTRRHFDGRLIDCMSNANETYYMAKDGALMRTSDDFWPDRPETHGSHLYANAQVSLWFGQFVHPDWDMFMSGHPMGAYHAAARAISGGPVYVSDAPETFDADLLRKLICADGTILRCRDIARPAPDSLFHDPTREPVLLKVFNHNTHGAVVGVFHAQTGASATDPLTGAVGPRDVPGWRADRTAVWAHRSQTLSVLGPEETIPVCLDPGGWELYTFAPLVDGVAPIGLAEKFNAGAAVQDLDREPRRLRLTLRDGGRLILAADQAPAEVVHEQNILDDVFFDAQTKCLSLNVPAAGHIMMAWM